MLKNKEDNASNVGGVAFVGCIILGTGIGLLAGNPGPYSVIGVGVGFIVMAIVSSLARKK